MFESATSAAEKAMEMVSSTSGVISKARSMVSGDAMFFSVAPKIDDLRYGLASDSLYEKRDAMKKIVAQMCKGANMKALFPDVVKNIHVFSTELRKLIYLFVVHYAEYCPNEALLSISAFQRDLVDPSMHVRSLALRMLSSIQIPAIHPVVMMAVRKCAADPASIVRKTAAIALFQVCCVSGRDTDMSSVHEVLRGLLADKTADVVGAAVMSYERICKHREDIIHPVFRNLCSLLPDCEEWGQDVMLRVLLRYARSQFCDPAKPPPGASENSSSSSDAGDSSSLSSSDGWSSSESSDDDFYRKKSAKKSLTDEAPLNPDHLLLLTAAKPLLFSLSSSVVVGVSALYVHCAPPRYAEYCVRPLMRVLRSAREGNGVILNTIHSLLSKNPGPFVPYAKEFYILSQDSADVRARKHRILSELATKENIGDLFLEYRSYVRGLDEAAVAEAVRGLGLIVSRHPTFSTLTMRLLSPLLTKGSPAIVAESVAVLRLLVMQGKDAQQSVKLVFRLMLDTMHGVISSPSAVSTVLWLVGECLRLHPAVAAAAPDCFRVFLEHFASLDSAVKQEVLTLGCKVWLQLDGSGEVAERFREMFFYALELARYDDDYAIRDHARLVECTCERDSDTFLAMKESLQGDKPLPCAADPYADRVAYELGTLSNYFGAPMFDYAELPEWRAAAPDSAVRRPLRGVAGDEVHSNPSEGGGGGAAAKKQKKKTIWSSSSSSDDDDDDEDAGHLKHGGGFYGDDSSEADSEQDDTSSHSSAASGTSDSGGAEKPSAAAKAPPQKPTAIKMTIKRV